ncbi:MAG: carbamoyltransferase HypF [Thermoplasmatales archaeon]|nr:carbamoyltransferase HypF [Thermoplasmatales archaeon]
MRVTIRGTVQGVGFRPSVYRAAIAVGARGTVRNEGAAVVIETDEAERLMAALGADMPPLASIDSVEWEESPVGDWDGFTIIQSSPGAGGVGIPADTAICEACLAEIRGGGHRAGYPFTTCTECGARYTLMEGVPYDRQRTSMGTFPMCPSCRGEYDDPGDRRFHHQTICCPRCGPSYRYVGADGTVDTADPIGGFASMLSSGGIGIAKGWGGMHICSLLSEIGRMRALTKREQKPFAVMFKDAAAARRYAEPTDAEMAELTSPARPIVLLRKSGMPVLEEVSPGLDTVGAFLPYTGMHHLLFDRVGTDALLMTSANEPGEPMAIDDAEALAMGADGYLLHDQGIVNRLDDSVVRLHGDARCFLRKSRGYVPSWTPFPSDVSCVAVGAQENLTSSVCSDGRIHTTQHIGDGDSYGVVDYLESAIRSLLGNLGCVPDVVVADMHPGYSNKRLAKSLATEFGCGYMEVQHHWAHAASLMAEHGIGELPVLCLDGTGYGADGGAWGGEVLRVTFESFERVAHLQGIPLIGGEAAVRDIRRLRFAIDEMNGVESTAVTGNEAAVMRKAMASSVQGTSMGRLMDALSYSLGVCDRRSYDGEPAMKLERLLSEGRELPGFEAPIVGGTVMTSHLFTDWPDARPSDIARSVVSAALTSLAEAACDAADATGVGAIGLSGGSTYNGVVREMVSSVASKRGLELISHRNIPNGDGGISVGQAAIAARGFR